MFVFDRLQQGVTGYLQKAPMDELRTRAALPGGTQCALDIGIVAFDQRGRERLSALSSHFGPAVERGEAYIDLYVEILTGALDGIPDAEFDGLVAPQSRLSPAERAVIRETMRGSALQGVLGRRSTFLHYGSAGEVPETAAAIAASGEIVPFYDVPVAAGLNHELRPRESGGIVVSDCENVTVGTGPVRIGEPSLVDNCGELTAEVAGGNLISGVERLHLPALVPAGFCLDGRLSRTVTGGESLTVAVYSRDDTFKAGADPVHICGEPLSQWLQSRGFTRAELGLPESTADDIASDIWDLPLWPALPEDVSPAARGHLVAAFWDASLADPAWRTWITATPRSTLRELTDSADLTAREARRTVRRARLLRAAVLEGRGWQTIPAAEAARIFSPEDRSALERLAASEPDELIRSYRGRFLAELKPGEPAESASSIQIPYLSSLTTPPQLRRSVKPDQIVWARIGCMCVQRDPRWAGSRPAPRCGWILAAGWSVPVGTCSPMRPSWQDQIGGVAGGVKYAVSTPGLRPELMVYQLDPWLFEAPEVVGRYTLFYTGATRLAKNILEDVVDSFNSMDPAYLFTVRRIGALADAARDAFSLRDVDRLARAIDESWKQNTLIHPSTANEEIDRVLRMVRGYYTSQKLLGAGGGGFAFFISKDAYWGERLREALVTASLATGNRRARVVDLSLNRAGLQVTVS